MADKDITTGLNKTASITTGDYMYSVVSPGNSRGILFQDVVSSIQTLGMSTAAITSGTFAHERGGLEADVSAYSGLVKITGGATSAVTVTAAGEALLDDADASAQRTTLGLGTIATQASSNVSITGGSVTGITDLAVADGGTGSSTAAAAKVALGIHDLGPNAQTGTSYTLVLADAGGTVTMSNAGANTLTIPTNASEAFDIGTVINVIQIGAGVTTIASSTGGTLNGVSHPATGAINNQYQGVSLLKIGTDTWIASGDIATVA